jgi:hypothetical protein
MVCEGDKDEAGSGRPSCGQEQSAVPCESVKISRSVSKTKNVQRSVKTLQCSQYSRRQIGYRSRGNLDIPRLHLARSTLKLATARLFSNRSVGD